MRRLWPWFLLLAVAALLEGVFIATGHPTLSQRYWSASVAFKVGFDVFVAALMLHLVFKLWKDTK